MANGNTLTISGAPITTSPRRWGGPSDRTRSIAVVSASRHDRGCRSADPTANTVYVGGNPHTYNLDTSGVAGAHYNWRTLDGGSTWRAVSQGNSFTNGLHRTTRRRVRDEREPLSRLRRQRRRRLELGRPGRLLEEPQHEHRNHAVPGRRSHRGEPVTNSRRHTGQRHQHPELRGVTRRPGSTRTSATEARRSSTRATRTGCSTRTSTSRSTSTARRGRSPSPVCPARGHSPAAISVTARSTTTAWATARTPFPSTHRWHRTRRSRPT